MNIRSARERRRKAGILDFYRDWEGVPYKSGGFDKNGIDCSGLMVLLYREVFETGLPASTYAQAKEGRRVRKSGLRAGDLVFFREKKNIHVGVYIGESRFIHASLSRGVEIAELDSYWSRLYWKARRLL